MKNFHRYIDEAIALTLQYHKELNPKLWKSNNLDTEVAQKLLKIADLWSEFSKIPKHAIRDILLVGGNANFNYTSYSDIDLHILIDKSQYENCPTILADYLKLKKQLWGNTHNITIYGHDVELYAQDITEPTPSDQGVYSIMFNKWIRFPLQQEVNFNDPALMQKVEDYASQINSLIRSNADEEACNKLKTKFREMRSAGLKQAGEFSIENMVFKELRNLGYIGRLHDYLRSRQDKALSL